MDLSQAEAIADLIHSDSKKVHQIAMNQMRGGYSDQIADLKQQLMNFASLIELELDFSEEDVEFASRTELHDLLEKLDKRLTQLTESFAFGNALKNGIQTVIAGRPNAGKSTLLNTLLNEERAIVSEIAGTTRDTIQELLNIEGVQFKFIDTAGIREASDEIERIGVERTLTEVGRSRILLYVFDQNELTEAEVLEDLSKLVRKGMDVIVVANKADLGAKDARFSQVVANYTTVFISAKEKDGIEALKSALISTIGEGFSEMDTIVVNARHYDAFSKALADIHKVREGLSAAIPGDLLAMDIRSAIRNLASITGEISTDDLLGNIFANFCIGK
jgi:tRNA modification GTPase